MAVQKPRSVEQDPLMSAKWDELTEGRNFTPADAPALTRLCSWYLIAERCLDDMTASGGIQVAYAVGNGISELPQVGTLTKAEAAIRGIEKSLGIYGTRDGSEDDDEDEDDVLTLVQGRGPAARRFAG